MHLESAVLSRLGRLSVNLMTRNTKISPPIHNRITPQRINFLVHLQLPFEAQHAMDYQNMD
jgi:hypothetical protein